MSEDAIAMMSETEGYCPDCDEVVPLNKIKTKRFAGERTTKCVHCWAKYLGMGGKTWGTFASGESLHHTLYCPTCGMGWNKKAANVLRPRECFKCRNGVSPVQALFQIDRAADRQYLEEEYIGRHEPHPLLRREPLTVSVPQEGRGLTLVEPNRDLCTDFEMVRSLIYPGNSYGRFDFVNNPRRKRRGR